MPPISSIPALSRWPLRLSGLAAPSHRYSHHAQPRIPTATHPPYLQPHPSLPSHQVYCLPTLLSTSPSFLPALLPRQQRTPHRPALLPNNSTPLPNPFPLHSPTSTPTTLLSTTPKPQRPRQSPRARNVDRCESESESAILCVIYHPTKHHIPSPSTVKLSHRKRVLTTVQQ